MGLAGSVISQTSSRGPSLPTAAAVRSASCCCHCCAVQRKMYYTLYYSMTLGKYLCLLFVHMIVHNPDSPLSARPASAHHGYYKLSLIVAIWFSRCVGCDISAVAAPPARVSCAAVWRNLIRTCMYNGSRGTVAVYGSSY